MPKPLTPAVWASGKSFAFQPSLAQQAQGFDYIATVRPGTGAPITDDHDWPLNQVTSALKWVMDQIPNGGFMYGCPLVGSLIHWPLQQMPQEIWPDCGMIFIPYIGQAFDVAKYPLLKQIHPSGVLPTDMRGEVSRGWDNGRGVDAGRALLSAQGDAIRNISGKITVAKCGEQIRSKGGVFSDSISTSYGSSTHNTGSTESELTIDFSAANSVPTATENRMRNVAWNMIVRAS